MSETTTTPDPAPPAKDQKPPKPTGWRKWRRRLSVLLLTVVIVGAILRLLVGILTPYVVRWTAHASGYDIQYSTLELSLLGGQAWLNDVRIKPRDGKDEDRILSAEYVRAHISPLNILRLHLKIYRAEADGATIDIVRLADGSIPYFTNLLGSNPPVASTTPTDITFRSPAEIDAVRLNRVTIHVTDHTVAPAFNEAISANIALSQIGFDDGKPATLEVNVGSTQLIDSLRILGQINAGERNLDSQIAFEVRGLRPDRAAPYLASLGIGANDRNVDVRGSVKAKLTSRADAPGTLAGTVSLDDVKLFAGRETVASLGTVVADVGTLSPSQLHLRSVDISGGSLTLQRSPEGVRFAAFSPAAAPRSTPTTAPATAAPSPTPTSPFVFKLDRLTIASMSAALEDYAVVPRTRVGFDVQKIEVKNVSTAGSADDETTLTASIVAPRLIRSITASGNLKLHRPAPTAKLDVLVEGIRPDAITPYLRPVGLAHTFQDGTLKAALEATVNTTGAEPRVDATVKTLNLSDRAGSLFDLADVRVRGFRVEGNGAAIVVDEIAGTGPKLTVRRRQDGAIEIPGLRYRTPAPAPQEVIFFDEETTQPTSPPATQVAAAPLKLPAIRIGKLTWGGVQVRLENELGRGVVDAIDIADAGAELTDFIFDPGDNASKSEKQGTLKAWLRSPGFIDSIDVSGSLVPTPGQVVANLDLTGRGLALTRLTPYLASFGVEPLIQAGTLDGKLLFLMRQRAGDESLTLSTHVEDFALRDGARELLAAKQLGYDWLLVAPGKLQVGNIWAIAPTLDVTIEKTGAISAAGIRYVTPKSPARAEGGPAIDPFALVQSLGLLTLDHAYLRDANVRITNSLGDSPVVTQVTASAQLDNFAINAAQDQTAYYWLSLGVDGAAKSAKVAGTIAPKRDALQLRAEVRGEGLTGASLASYVPPQVALNLADATVAVDSDVSVAKHAAGGYAGAVSVKNLNFRELGAADPYAAMRSFDLVVDRVDVPAGIIAVKSIALDGLDAQARRGADGKIALLGTKLTGAVAPIDAAPTAQTEVDVDAVVAAAKQKWPLLSVESVDLNIARLQFTDDFRPDAAPVAVRDLTVKSRQPLKLLGPAPAESTPVALDIAGTVTPAIGRFEVGVVANAFIEKPTLAADVSLSGISGAGIVSIVPEVKPFLDGSSLADGRFKATLRAEAAVRRRGPVVIEFSRGIDLSFDLTDVALTDGADSPALAGVGRVHGEQVKIDPISGAVNARLIEVTDVKGFAYRDAAGIHVLGFTVKPPGAGDSAGDTAGTTGTAPVAESSATAAPISDAGPEIRLNRVLVSGADLKFEDRMVNPIVEIPINQLEMDLRGLSSHVLTRDRPVRFNVNVGAGEVSLPKKGRGAKEGEFEDRPFFAQVTAFGEMALAPQLRGRGVFAANGVELNAIRGVASAYGAGLSDGTFDGRAELRSRDDGAIDVRSKLVLTDLEYSEPENGIVQRLTKLPTPIDTVIWVLKSPDGTINLPVNFKYRPARNPVGDVIGAAIPAVAAQIIVGANPLSIAAKLAGAGGGNAQQDVVEDAPVVLQYPTGLTSMTAEMSAKLDALAEEVKRDKGVSVSIAQRFGAGDETLARARANPDPTQAHAMAEQLRDRRAELIQQRDLLLATSRAESLGAGETIQAAGSTESLKALQQQIADVEEAFDWMYDLQRPGAETQAARRARSGALAMITQRKDLVERALKRRLADPDAESRVTFAAPKVEPADGDASELVIVVKRTVPQKK